MLEIGVEAPGFTLPDQNGTVHSLSDYRGQDETMEVITAYDVLKLGKDGKPTKSLIRSTYLIDENGVILQAFGGVKPKENADQILDELA